MTPSPEILAQTDPPLQKVVSFDTFCLVARQRYKIEKKVPLQLIRSRHELYARYKIEKEVPLQLIRSRHELSNEPSTKVLRCP